VNHNSAPAAAGGQRPTTQDLLLKHSDKTCATYIWKQMKHLKHASIVIAICATPDQLLKHLDETFETNF
jgi:hypothetical protein